MRIIIVFLVGFLLILVGCGNGSDFNGIILEVKNASIVVGTDDVDPEASYPTYEILVDDETEFLGEVDDFSEFKKDLKVDIWVLDNGENNSIDNIVASKIVVE
ncbi:hypothetical protein CR203_20375 [Salipaludibacillus neizhouensis]|uniref:DUF3221 domain-containing protein n=1 Tax=Salipaludibacillus neizhouensis TaxID=885475 RepID=A0A3A9JYK1_9BACI|nr:hypothetical protein [Salipaludibacillus neizhouensis]RKL65557.1 hypothetical protein CR203_20375 [Salipaludibacillus neizhouensis]